MYNITCKNDPACSYIIPLKETWNVEDSIDTLNYNISSLDVELCNLAYSATMVDPAITWFVSNSSTFINVMNFVQSASSKIESAATTVHTLSSFWLTPITIIYKDILETFNTPAVTAWVNSNFPQRNGNCVNYLNGQKMYVYSLKYSNINNTVSDTTVQPGYYTEYCYWVKKINSRVQKCINVFVPPKSITTSSQCVDKYVGEIRGLEYCMSDGTWIHTSTLPI